MASEAQTSKIDDQTQAAKALSQSTIVLRAHSMIGSNTPVSLIVRADMAFETACRKVIDRARRSNTEIVTVIHCKPRRFGSYLWIINIKFVHQGFNSLGEIS